MGPPEILARVAQSVELGGRAPWSRFKSCPAPQIMPDISPSSFTPVTKEQSDAMFDVESRFLLFCGPWGCGKTEVTRKKPWVLASRYPGIRILLLRWTQAALRMDFWPKFIETIPEGWVVPGSYNKADLKLTLRPPHGVDCIVQGGGLKPQEGGTNRYAGQEFDYICIEEGKEVQRETDFREMVNRCLRAGDSPIQQICIATNPDTPSHWLHKAFYEGGNPKYRAIDFPTIPKTAKRPSGRPVLSADYYDDLDGLTGILRAKYRDGKWVAHEGLVYPYDPRVQVIRPEGDWWVNSLGDKVAPYPFPTGIPCIQDTDFGFYHPFVYHWWRKAAGDIWFLQKQVYMTHRTVEEHAPTIHAVCKEIGCKPVTFCDHDAEDAATLELHGIRTIKAYKSRLAGQQAMYDLFPHAIDSAGEELTKCRIYFCADSLVELDRIREQAKLPIRTEQEFGTYTWANNAKEDMVKDRDDGVDAARYGIASYYRGTGTVKVTASQVMPELAGVRDDWDYDGGDWGYGG